MKYNKRKEQGFGMVEIIVCLAIITTAFWGFLELARYNLQINRQNKETIEALNLAQESLEVVRGVRGENWSNLIILSYNTKYYPIISEGRWTLSASSPGNINGIYSQWITLERVYRNSNDDISSSGSEDSNTKKINSVVQWQNKDKIYQVQLATYLTNWNE